MWGIYQEVQIGNSDNTHQETMCHLNDDKET